jgi:cellulose synthase/poly-beta-1,6-N-acetylglucosamine synthase-like glycosyltransferase
MIESKPQHQRDFRYKLFERIPAITFVSILAFLLLGGFFVPEITAYAIIIINVYFLYKSGSLSVFTYYAFNKIWEAESIDWLQKLKALDSKKQSIEKLKQEAAEIKKVKYGEEIAASWRNSSSNTAKFWGILKRVMFWFEKRKLLNFLNKERKKLEKVKVYNNWEEIQHIIIIPHVKEPEHILRETLDNLRKQNFPLDQINIVLAAESRDPNGLPLSKKLAKDYKGVFNNIWVSNHVLTDEEIVGKSSNMKAGGKVAYEAVTKLGWDLKKTLVTSCDADSKLPEQYYSYVTYEYVTTEHAHFKFFNAAMVFYNNIWRLPFYARVKNSMSTLISVSRLPRTDKLIPFSTYSTSFWMIKQIGFWTPWVTPEDFHLFLKAQFKFGGIVSTKPIYLRIMSDAAEGRTHKDTILNNYKQERRWQWGISDDGWVLQNVFYNFWKHDFVTIYRALHSVFDHVMAPVIGILLVVGGNIPPLINPDFTTTVLGARLPQVSSSIITISLVFMIFLILIDVHFKPKRTGIWYPLGLMLQILEWLFLPFASFFLAVLPGIEANTRLLFGKYLEYYVTKKH